MYPSIGIGELIVFLISIGITLVLPLGILYFLVKIYIKLKDIEQHLKDK